MTFRVDAPPPARAPPPPSSHALADDVPIDLLVLRAGEYLSKRFSSAQQHENPAELGDVPIPAVHVLSPDVHVSSELKIKTEAEAEAETETETKTELKPFTVTATSASTHEGVTCSQPLNIFDSEVVLAV